MGYNFRGGIWSGITGTNTTVSVRGDPGDIASGIRNGDPTQLGVLPNGSRILSQDEMEFIETGLGIRDLEKGEGSSESVESVKEIVSKQISCESRTSTPAAPSNPARVSDWDLHRGSISSKHSSEEKEEIGEKSPGHPHGLEVPLEEKEGIEILEVVKMI